MADKNREYALIVLYASNGSVKSRCISETPGQARSICRTYQRHHAERDGWKVRVYPVASRKEARDMTPPALSAHVDAPTACIHHTTQAQQQMEHSGGPKT